MHSLFALFAAVALLRPIECVPIYIFPYDLNSQVNDLLDSGAAATWAPLAAPQYISQGLSSYYGLGRVDSETWIHLESEPTGDFVFSRGLALVLSFRLRYSPALCCSTDRVLLYTSISGPLFSLSIERANPPTSLGFQAVITTGSATLNRTATIPFPPGVDTLDPALGLGTWITLGLQISRPAGGVGASTQRTYLNTFATAIETNYAVPAQFADPPPNAALLEVAPDSPLPQRSLAQVDVRALVLLNDGLSQAGAFEALFDRIAGLTTAPAPVQSPREFTFLLRFPGADYSTYFPLKYELAAAVLPALAESAGFLTDAIGSSILISFAPLKPAPGALDPTLILHVTTYIVDDGLRDITVPAQLLTQALGTDGGSVFSDATFAAGNPSVRALGLPVASNMTVRTIAAADVQYSADWILGAERPSKDVRDAYFGGFLGACRYFGGHGNEGRGGAGVLVLIVVVCVIGFMRRSSLERRRRQILSMVDAEDEGEDPESGLTVTNGKRHHPDQNQVAPTPSYTGTSKKTPPPPPPPPRASASASASAPVLEEAGTAAPPSDESGSRRATVPPGLPEDPMPAPTGPATLPKTENHEGTSRAARGVGGPDDPPRVRVRSGRPSASGSSPQAEPPENVVRLKNEQSETVDSAAGVLPGGTVSSAGPEQVLGPSNLTQPRKRPSRLGAEQPPLSSQPQPQPPAQPAAVPAARSPIREAPSIPERGEGPTEAVGLTELNLIGYAPADIGM